jgi:signal transduction histidine kinase
MNYVGVAWDISELKKSQRLKEEFITTISHELRTPLTSVLGSLGMLMENMTEQLPEQAQRLIALAHSNSRRLVRLISDILDIEKIEAGKMTFQFEPLDLTVLVSRVVEDCKAIAEQAQVRIALKNLSINDRINGDADRLMQAVTNLLSNAIKFSPPGNQVEIVVDSHGPMLRVEVTDHGDGIPEEFHGHIFKKFVQAGRTNRDLKVGTGLGLSIARLIVQEHGGSIDFSSLPGAPTTFYIDLPRVDLDLQVDKPVSMQASTGCSRNAES